MQPYSLASVSIPVVTIDAAAFFSFSRQQPGAEPPPPRDGAALLRPPGKLLLSSSVVARPSLLRRFSHPIPTTDACRFRGTHLSSTESPGPSAPPATGSRLAAATNAGVLPLDVLFDVLLRLSAKQLCRLRAVCRSWRTLTSDPLFTGAHAARHPLFLAYFRGVYTHIHVVGLSGSVVKQIPNVYGRLLPTSLDLARAVWNTCHVLDPATGSVCVLPENPATEHVGGENLSKPYATSLAFGKIAAAGEYKVVRMLRNPTLTPFNQEYLYEVLTINSGSGSSQPQWRATRGHDDFVHPDNPIRHR
nr:unnamed protein product [Digitaria exilis]